MFRLRGSHGLSPNSPTPRTFQLLGCGQREDSDPAVFFCQRKEQKNEKDWRIVFIYIGFNGLDGFKLLSLLAIPNIR